MSPRYFFFIAAITISTTVCGADTVPQSNEPQKDVNTQKVNPGQHSTAQPDRLDAASDGADSGPSNNDAKKNVKKKKKKEKKAK